MEAPGPASQQPSSFGSDPTAATLYGGPFMLLQKGRVEDTGAQPLTNTEATSL